MLRPSRALVWAVFVVPCLGLTACKDDPKVIAPSDAGGDGLTTPDAGPDAAEDAEIIQPTPEDGCAGAVGLCAFIDDPLDGVELAEPGEVTLSATVVNGSGDYTYTWSGYVSGSEETVSGSFGVGSHLVTLRVVDNQTLHESYDHRVVNVSTGALPTIRIDGAAPYRRLPLGGRLDLSATVTGGTAPYTVTWTFTPERHTGLEESSFEGEDPDAWLLPTPGDYLVSVEVVDAAGDTGQATVRARGFRPSDFSPAVLIQDYRAGDTDLYAVSRDGEQYVNLSWGTISSQTRLDHVGSISPDGRWVTFSAYLQRDGERVAGAWLAPTDGSAEARLIQTHTSNSTAMPGDYDWSPDGRYLAFEAVFTDLDPVEPRLWVYDTTSETLAQVSPDPASSSFQTQFFWAPSSELVLLAADNLDAQVTDFNGERSVAWFASSPDGASVEQLTQAVNHDPAGSAWSTVGSPHVSPDSTKFLYTADLEEATYGRPRLVDIATKAQAVYGPVFDPNTQTSDVACFPPLVPISADGQWLLTLSNLENAADDTWNLYLENLLTGEINRLNSVAADFNTGVDNAQFLSSGTTVLFWGDIQGPQNIELWIAPNGSGGTLVTDRVREIRVSRDEQHVAILADPDQDSREDLFVVGSDGAGLTDLTGGMVADEILVPSTEALSSFIVSDANPEDLSWFSPDGTHVLFILEDTSGLTLYAAPVDGGPPVQVSETDANFALQTGFEVGPKWFSDGTGAVYVDSAWRAWFGGLDGTRHDLSGSGSSDPNTDGIWVLP